MNGPLEGPLVCRKVNPLEDPLTVPEPATANQGDPQAATNAANAPSITPDIAPAGENDDASLGSPVPDDEALEGPEAALEATTAPAPPAPTICRQKSVAFQTVNTPYIGPLVARAIILKGNCAAPLDPPVLDEQAPEEVMVDDQVATTAIAPVTEALDASMEPVVDDEDPGPDPVAEAVNRLAGLSPQEYDRERKKEALALGLRISTLDEAVKQAHAAHRHALGNGKAVSFPAIELWGERVEVGQVLDEIQETIRRFIVCDIETAAAAVLWIVFTWFIDYVQVAPIAAIVSPLPRCGKTQFLDVLSRLSCRPLVASNISPAAVFRVIEAHSPTLLIDEADTFLKENEPMRGVLNSGHTRQSAFVIRTDGDPSVISKFSTWSAKAIASIGHLSGTIMDRSIELPLRRKLPTENVQRLRHADPAQFSTLVRKLARLAEDMGSALAQARPDLPPELNDRAQDNWEPLLAIADLAGGHWPQKARVAALKLSGADHEAVAPPTELLADIRDAFGPKDKISTADLLAALVRDEPGLWGRSAGGRPMSASQLATRLKEFGIRSQDIKFPGNTTLKGYRLNQFQDAFDRYLPSPAKGAGPATPQLSSAGADL